MTDSDTNDTSFASEEYYTDTDNLDVSPRTNLELSPRTCDLRYSDDDWIQCTSSDNVLILIKYF